MRKRFLAVALIMVLSGCSTSSPQPGQSTAVDQIVTTAVAPVSTSGWTSEPVGDYSQFVGGVDTIAFAPDSRSVAFTNVDTSCCSSATFGWVRSAGGLWQPIANSQDLFVAGPVGGTLGGPTDVVWFKDRFVAVGTRGAGVPGEQAEGNTPAIPTVWTSPDGLTWTATEQPGTLTPTHLQASLSNDLLFGVWTSDENSVVRSTSDGTVWETVSTLTPFAAGQTLYPKSITSISSPDDKPANYAIVGTVNGTSPSTQSSGFVAVSKDGVTWTSRQLSMPQAISDSSADHALFFDGKIMVYGTAYSSQDDGTPVETAIGWTSTDGGLTYTESPIQSNCGGAFSGAVVDRAAPEPTMFAICTAVVGPQEGDYIASTDQLMVTRNGVDFETPPNMSPEWSTPSEDIAIGPLSLDNGRVVLPVAIPNGDAGRRIALWRA
jgi:hypothetical protein